jgi:hypothetical protein
LELKSMISITSTAALDESALNILFESVQPYTADADDELALLPVPVPVLAPASAPPPKTWRTAALIEPEKAAADFAPQVAMNARGDAVAIWRQPEEAHTKLWASRYITGLGWCKPELVKTGNAGDMGYPHVAMDSSGNAIAVWRKCERTRSDIWASRYTAEAGWSAATQIKTNNASEAFAPQIAVDAAGNAWAIWQESCAARNSVWACRYVAGLGWQAAVQISTGNSSDVSAAQIAMNAGGTAIAVWRQVGGESTSIWANSGAAPTQAGTAFNPQIALNATGSAVVVWVQSCRKRASIWSNRYAAAGQAWGAAQQIDADSVGVPLCVQVAMDTSGNALMVWEQMNGERVSINASRYLAQVGWGKARVIDAVNAGDALAPKLAMDASGNATAVWQQFDGNYRGIWTNRYTLGAGWGVPRLVKIDNAGDAFDPQVAVDASGNAVAVWQQIYGTRFNIWANVYC